MKKEITRYGCVGDSGRAYTVIEYQHIIRSDPVNGASQDVLGTTFWLLSDGRDVNFIDDKTFQVVCANEFVRKTG
jgi:hypothetical protein